MRRLLLLIAIGTLLLAACGDDDGGDESGGGDEGTLSVNTDDDGGDESGGGDEGTLSVNTIDFAFDPAAYNISAGEETTVQVVNEAADVHTWVVMKPGASAEDYIKSIRQPGFSPEPDGTSEDTLVKASASGGTEGTPVTFTIQEAGTYQVICDIPGHLEDGMEGELVVE